MARRVLLVLLTLYLAADFADPLMPGIVQFIDGQLVFGADLSTPETVSFDEPALVDVHDELTPRREQLPRFASQVPPRHQFSPPRLVRAPDPDSASVGDDH